MRLTFSPKDNLFERFAKQLDALSEGDGHKAMARAVNRVTDTVEGRVARAVTKQSSIPRQIVKDAIRKQKAPVATIGPLEGQIIAKGKGVPLKEFGPKQFAYGTRARVFGKQERFEIAFLFSGTYRSGIFAHKGHVLKRRGEENPKTGRDNLARPVYGPSVPSELVKDTSKEAFETTVRDMLPARVKHELERLIGK